MSAKDGEVLKPSYSIAPLLDVWDEYENARLQMQIDAQKFSTITSITGILMPMGMVAALIPGMEHLRFVFIGISLLFAIVFFVIRWKKSNTGPLKQKELTDNFKRSYVCPNPKCKRGLAGYSSDELVKLVCCPHCKVKFRQ